MNRGKQEKFLISAFPLPPSSPLPPSGIYELYAYEFTFSGHVCQGGPLNFRYQVLLKGVDGNVKASVSSKASSSDTRGHLPVSLSAVTPLRIGEKIGICHCRAYWKLYDWGPIIVTRFSCTFLSAVEKNH